ncbi:TonB-dependent receptor [Pedobacter nyackensis]|uniref:TonB-dependent receptor n=1 Tax=Pedobacter nyackensis TaxID=475255 RepID=UPI00292F8A69|nr:TonB-dependent receptor [Pedobacter nyackensis]
MYKKYTTKRGMGSAHAVKILRIMRLTTAILIATFMQVSASGLAQRITLSRSNTSLKDVLREIRKQSGYNFLYTDNILKKARPVNVKLKEIKIEEALKQIFENQFLTYSINENTVTIREKEIFYTAGNGIIRRETIKGEVLDELGKPIPGVNILVKGTNKGTSTDSKGTFSIVLATGEEELIISAIGYISQTIVVGKETSLHIVLKEETSRLEEVVVVGYGTQKRRDLSTAVSSVGSKEILESKSFSVSNSLAGRVPGLIVNQRNSRPGNDEASIFIRGASTTGNASALIVVDGVANRDGISRIDPSDIESISVLKDASAAIYGAQSANGVVLITTKRGKTGKPSVNYSFNHGIVSPTRYMKMSNAADYVKGINDLDRQAGRPLTYTTQQLSDYANGVLPSTDWLRATQKSSFNQDRHNLSVSGGTEAVKYFLSLGMGTQGTINVGDKTSKYAQYNFRSNIDAQVSKNFSVGLDVAGRKQNRNFLGVNDGALFSWSVLGPPVLPATILGGYPAAGRGNNNPLGVVTGESYDKTENFLFNGTLKAKYKIPGVEGLSIDGFFAIDQGQNFQKVWQQPWTFYVEENGVAVPRTRPNPASLSEGVSKSQSITKNAKLNYEREFDKHTISAFVSFEQNESNSQNFSASRVGFASSAIDQLFAGSPIKDNQSNNGTAGDGARQNYLGRISYAYNKKYLAQFYVGINGSQIFPKGQRFGNFPGGSLGWVMSEESFMKDISLVNALKIRASYGLLGNDRVLQYQYLNVYNFGSGYVFDGKDVSTLNPGVAANPYITWEKKKSFDIGLDATILNNSLSFTVDYFKSRTSDILAKRNATVPNYTGLLLPNENIGIVDNAGIDGEINYTKTFGGLRFNVGGNFTYAKNKVVFVDEVPPVVPYQNTTGRPLGTQFLYKVIGVYRTADDLSKYPGLDGKRLGDLIYEDVSGDGKVNGDDRYPIERNATPQIQYGFNLGFQYAQFDFSAQLQGQARAVQYFGYLFDNSNNAPEYFVKNAWTPENVNAPLPSIGRSAANNDLFLRDVSFLRLKNIELGYTFSKDLLSKIGLQSSRLFVNGYNLLTFDKLKKDGLGDPEIVDSRGFVFPQTKIISFGLNATF